VCRYYPVALLSIRRQDEFTDRTAYALVQESDCHVILKIGTLTVTTIVKSKVLEEYMSLGDGGVS